MLTPRIPSYARTRGGTELSRGSTGCCGTQVEVKGLEAERDFYLHKLLAIEQAAQAQAAASPTAKRTLQILSARA